MKKQIQQSWQYARAYGHLWADNWDGQAPPEEVSLEEIYAISARREEEAHNGYAFPQGIPGPKLEDDGVAVHTTATGRTSWDIYPDGVVHLIVCRRGATTAGIPVIEATVIPEGEVSARLISGDGVCAFRHLGALAGALLVVVSPEVAREALLPLVPEVRPELADSNQNLCEWSALNTVGIEMPPSAYEILKEELRVENARYWCSEFRNALKSAKKKELRQLAKQLASGPCMLRNWLGWKTYQMKEGEDPLRCAVQLVWRYHVQPESCTPGDTAPAGRF